MRSFFFALGCGNPTVIDGKAYSTACVFESDCVGVFVGDQCQPCACANAAISTSDKTLYEADRFVARAACEPGAATRCAPCEERRPTCVPRPNPISFEAYCRL
jgi:hypothetical protein